MPLFGSRMVVGTAHYKHKEEFQEDMNDREEDLAQWEKEKKERMDRLKMLNEKISSSRRGSMVSTASDMPSQTNLGGDRSLVHSGTSSKGKSSEVTILIIRSLFR